MSPDSIEIRFACGKDWLRPELVEGRCLIPERPLIVPNDSILTTSIWPCPMA